MGRDIPPFSWLPSSTVSRAQHSPVSGPARLPLSTQCVLPLPMCVLARLLASVPLGGWVPACVLLRPWWRLAGLDTGGAWGPPQRVGARPCVCLRASLSPPFPVSMSSNGRGGDPGLHVSSRFSSPLSHLQVSRTCSPQSPRRSRLGASTPT